MGVEKYRVGEPETVKSRAKLSPSDSRRAALGLACALGLLSSSAPSTAKRPKNEPAILLGGAPETTERPVDTDPLLPHGEVRPPAWRATSTSGGLRRCSIRRPVCVDGDEPALVGAALALLEDAYERVVFGSGLPRPDGDAVGTLTWTLEPRSFDVPLELRPSVDFDRGRARCLGGSVSEETALRCILEASHGTLAPATARVLAKGATESSLASFVGGLTLARWARARLEEPERGALTTNEPSWFPARSALFFSYLEERAENPRPAEVPAFLLALAATKTPAGSLRYESEPDVVDVVRRSLHEERSAYARFFDGYARALLALGSSDFLPEIGEPLRPRYAWDIEGASLPRNLVLPRGIEPSGSAYVRVRLAPALRDKTLVFKASCEAPIRTIWSVVLDDDQGKQLRTIELPFVESSSSHAERIELDERTAAATLVGTNLDWVDLAHPFDPDHGPHEAHVCTVYVLTL